MNILVSKSRCLCYAKISYSLHCESKLQKTAMGGWLAEISNGTSYYVLNSDISH